MLTGQYAHNHGVLSSWPPWGGFARLRSSETLAVWLQRAGYATALVGKYLNGYGRHNRREVPAGWTEWHGILGGSTYQYYGYTINAGGLLRTYGYAPADYQTDVLTARAEAVVRRRAPDPAPFFLWLAYVAPHAGQPHDPFDPPFAKTAVPAPRHRGAFAGLPLPRPPSFDEADVSDKPRAIRARPRFGATGVATVRAAWQQRRAALLAVDEGVARVVAALRNARELDRTLVIFTSDNGYLSGEHRATEGKVLAYEPSIRVPLLMRGPGVPRGDTRRQLVWNGDVAPTILEAAGARSPWRPDGESLWRFVRRPQLHSRRAVLLEGPPLKASRGRPRFTGVRTEAHVYLEHSTGERELYDLRRDPDELRNLAGRPGAVRTQRALARRLARLRTCKGRSCRSPR